MVYLLELLSLVAEPVLLFIGAVFSYVLGNATYTAINHFLYSITTPCLEATTLLVALISPVVYFYGVHHKKIFAQRSDQHNLIIFLVSFCFGVLIGFLPISYIYTVDSTTLSCPPQVTLIDKLSQSVATGIITSLVAFLNLDIGVLYAFFIRNKFVKKGKKKK